MEGRVESPATLPTQGSQHGSQNRSDPQAGAEAATAHEALLSTKAAEAAGATAELSGKAAEAGESTKAAAGSAHAATGLESGLEAGLLLASLIAGLESVLPSTHAREATAHHLLHLGQLLLHLLHLLLHLSLLEASLERVLGSAELAGEALAGELPGTSARLHGEVVKLLSLLTAAMLLFAEKLAEQAG